MVVFLNLVGVCLLLGMWQPVCAESVSKDSYLNLGFNAQYFGYKEFDDQGVLLDREDGLMPGLVMEFGKDWNLISGAVRFELIDGVVDYDGQTQAGVPVTTNTDERIVTLEALIRYRLKQLPEFNLTVVGGLGHREWRRNIRATDITSSLYEVYEWRYWFLGGAATVWRNGQWSAGIDAGWLYPIKPNISIDLTGYDEVRLSLKPHSSGRISFPLRYVVSDGQEWTLSPYWESWRLGRSADKVLTVGGVPTTAIVHEPRSETSVVGLVMSVQL